MPRRNGTDREARGLDRLAGSQLDDVPHVPGGPAGGTQAAWHDDGRATRQPLQRGEVEVLRMPVGDRDDIGLQLAGVGERAVPLERPEPRAKERIGEDADATKLDQRRGVADVSNGDRRRGLCLRPF